MFQKTTVLGHLGDDAEIRYTPAGRAVAKFSVAASEKWKKDGEPHEVTTWFRCVAFGALAESVGQYLRKGTLVFVAGRIRTDKYQDREGVERWSWSLIVDDLRLCGGRSESSTRTEEARREAPARDEPPPLDDDIPF